jgi:hypothetical protein
VRTYAVHPRPLMHKGIICLFSHTADPGTLSRLLARKARETSPHKPSSQTLANAQCVAIIYNRLRRVEGQAFQQCSGLAMTRSSAMAGHGAAAMIDAIGAALKQQLDNRVAGVVALRASLRNWGRHTQIPGSQVS